MVVYVRTTPYCSIHLHVAQEACLSEQEENIRTDEFFSNIDAKGTSKNIQIVPIIISNGAGCEEKIYAFLDNNSEVALISQQLGRLHLQGPVDMLRHKLLHKTTRLEKERMRMFTEVSDIGRVDTFKLHNARTVSSLRLPSQSISVESLQVLHHLRAIPLVKMFTLTQTS